ncbi:MAG: hypothetical protein RLY31_1605 [Bacteroidota bacterium]|jgi:4-amino-4-deoxy-L-arabinose transferase-like glycosyltransferase
MKKSAAAWVLAGLFALFCYFPLFHHLDHMSLRLWDEARRGVNALDMAENGNWLVTHYEGSPEMWGTKPPFLIWCQVLFLKLLGDGELALRLPSALAALATVILLVWSGARVLRQPLTGLLAGMVLLCTKGYVGAHVARSGDFDALLTLWETCYLLCFFQWWRSWRSPASRRWLFLTAAGIGMAGLTKGIAGFLFLPGLVLFLLLRGLPDGPKGPAAMLHLLRRPATWLAAGLALLPPALFYIGREIANPGYLAAVMDNEVGGRFLVAQGGHNHPWFHYLEWLWREQFQPWILFLPLAWIACWQQGGLVRDLTLLLTVVVVSFLGVISAASTRIMWYMAPAYPLLAFLVAIGLSTLFSESRPSKKSWSAGVLLAFALFFQPYRAIVERSYREQHPAWDWHELKYRDFMRQVPGVRDYTIVHAHYNSHVVFYARLFNRAGARIRYHPLFDIDRNPSTMGEGPLAFQPGDTLMVCEKQVWNALDTTYRYRSLYSWDGCQLLVVTGKVAEPPEKGKE